MLNITFIYEDSFKHTQTNISGSTRCHGVKHNGKRPITAYIYTDPIESFFDVEKLETFITKYLFKTLHPLKSDKISVSSDIKLLLSEAIVTKYIK